jgi:hypothetical protein
VSLVVDVGAGDQADEDPEGGDNAGEGQDHAGLALNTKKRYPERYLQKQLSNKNGKMKPRCGFYCNWCSKIL